MNSTMRSFKIFFRAGSFSSIRFVKAENYDEAAKKADAMAINSSGLTKGASYKWIAEGVFEQEVR